MFQNTQKMLVEIHKEIWENLESYRIEKWCIIKKHEEFDRCAVGLTSFDPYQVCGDEADEDIEIEVVIRASRVQYALEEDVRSASMRLAEQPQFEASSEGGSGTA